MPWVVTCLPIMWTTVGWVMVPDALRFWLFGLYRGLWRYASIHDLRLIVVAVGVATRTSRDDLGIMTMVILGDSA